MKMEASAFVKQVWSILKSHTNVFKEKTSDVIKTKAVLVGLLKNKKFIRTVRHKMNSILHWEGEEYKSMAVAVYRPSSCEENEAAEVDYLSRTMFDSDDNPRNSVAILLDGRISTSMDAEQLEEEIDNLADVFISRFRLQMRMQRSDSMKQYEDMLRRSA